MGFRCSGREEMASMEGMDTMINWLKVGVYLISIGFWISVWYNGFFTSLIWLIVISSIIGVVVKLTEKEEV